MKSALASAWTSAWTSTAALGLAGLRAWPAAARLGLVRDGLSARMGPWWLACALLLAALALMSGLAPHWRAQAAEALSEVDASRSMPGPAAPAAAPGPAPTAATEATPTAATGTSRAQTQPRPEPGWAARPAPAASAQWPSAQQLDRRLADVLTLAKRQGIVVLNQSERVDRGGHLQLTLGLQAEYPALRRFVAAALAADAALALDSLRIQRNDEADSRLEVQLRWTLWQHSQGQP